jgi:putative ABC transport system permease protein
VDLVAVTAKPGVSSAVLAGRIRMALHGGRGYTIATGSARGDVADLNAAVERSDGQVLGAALIPSIVTISLFVLAATTGLAVSLRRRRFALLRTVGATRGQVRRAAWPGWPRATPAGTWPAVTWRTRRPRRRRRTASPTT